MDNEVKAWRDRFPQYEYRIMDDVVTLKLNVPKFGCHCELGVGEKADECVLDTGSMYDCRHAIKLVSQGKGKENCHEWKEIKFTPSSVK